MPANALPESGLLGRYHLDKVVHAVLFGIFLLLLVRAIARSPKSSRPGPWPMVIAAMGAIGFGALTEVLQEWAGAGRSGDPWDLLADAVGVILAMVVLLWGPVGAAHFWKRSERYF